MSNPRSLDSGPVAESSVRDRVLSGLPSASDAELRAESLDRVFGPDWWHVAQSLVDQGGAVLLCEVASSSDLAVIPAVKRAVRLGVADLAVFRRVTDDPRAYLQSTQPPEYPHVSSCSAHGSSRWANVDDCGYCDHVASQASLGKPPPSQRGQLWASPSRSRTSSSPSLST